MNKPNSNTPIMDEIRLHLAAYLLTAVVAVDPNWRRWQVTFRLPLNKRTAAWGGLPHCWPIRIAVDSPQQGGVDITDKFEPTSLLDHLLDQVQERISGQVGMLNTEFPLDLVITLFNTVDYPSSPSEEDVPSYARFLDHDPSGDLTLRETNGLLDLASDCADLCQDHDL